MAPTRPNQNRPVRSGASLNKQRYTIPTAFFVNPEPTPPKSPAKTTRSSTDAAPHTPTPAPAFRVKVQPPTPTRTPGQSSPRSREVETEGDQNSEEDDDSSSDISDTPPSIPDPKWIQAAQKDAAAAFGSSFAPKNPTTQPTGDSDDDDDDTSSDISDTPPSLPDPAWMQAAEQQVAAASRAATS